MGIHHFNNIKERLKMITARDQSNLFKLIDAGKASVAASHSAAVLSNNAAHKATIEAMNANHVSTMAVAKEAGETVHIGLRDLTGLVGQVQTNLNTETASLTAKVSEVGNNATSSLLEVLTSVHFSTHNGPVEVSGNDGANSVD